jgi:hypothetical protein
MKKPTKLMVSEKPKHATALDIVNFLKTHNVVDRVAVDRVDIAFIWHDTFFEQFNTLSVVDALFDAVAAGLVEIVGEDGYCYFGLIKNKAELKVG